MIVYKRWVKYVGMGKSDLCDGWFPFGLIPLYIRIIKAKAQ